MSKVDYIWEHDGVNFQIQARFLQMREGRQNPVFHISLMNGRDSVQFRHLAMINITADGFFRPSISQDARTVNASDLQAIAAFFDELSRDNSELWGNLIKLMEEAGLRWPDSGQSAGQPVLREGRGLVSSSRAELYDETVDPGDENLPHWR